MADEIKKSQIEEDAEDEELVDVFTLQDMESGEETSFILLAEVEMDGKNYVALEPQVEEPTEYVILEQRIVDGVKEFETIEDDEEFDKVADFFDDLLFSEVDHDEE